MNQKQIDDLTEALRRQGLTWSQTNFAVSLVRNSVAAERERWQRIATNAQAVTTGCADKLDYFEVPSHLMAALALALDTRGPGFEQTTLRPVSAQHYTEKMTDERVRQIVRDELQRAGLLNSPNA